MTITDAAERKWAKTAFDQLSPHQQHSLQSAGEEFYEFNLNSPLTFMNPVAVKMVG